MFKFDIAPKLQKKLDKLNKKNKTLSNIFFKKVEEIISRDEITINTYNNLRAPLNEFKRIHLTDNYIIIFTVDTEEGKIIFMDILHRDHAYA